MRALAPLLLLALALPVLAADPPKPDPKEKITNWEYANWSKFKVGTSVTTKISLTIGGKTAESGTIVTLLEVKEKSLVLETVPVSKEFGKEEKGKPSKRTVMKEASEVGNSGKDPKTGLPDDITDEGKETLKIGGTEYECKWYKFKIKNSKEEVTGQVWVCDDVPGRQVKFFTKSKSGGSSHEVSEVTIKK